MPDQQPGSVEQRKRIPAYLCTIIFTIVLLLASGICGQLPLAELNWEPGCGSLYSQLLGAKSTESG